MSHNPQSSILNPQSPIRTAMWVKICGIRDIETANRVAAVGPDAIGLNFYAKTARYVDPSVAESIVVGLPEGMTPIGLFVNHPVEEVAEICRTTGIRIVQIHGDEPPEMLAELRLAAPELQIIRAFRVAEGGLSSVETSLQRYRELGVPLFACLIDSRVSGTYGGSGKQAPWEMIAKDYRFDEWPPLILAGGLTANNVADAIAAVNPWGVDTAGGCESAPGVKDDALIARFVKKAKQAEE